MLVEGRMVLTPDSGDLLRVEGKLSKNPSFWTSLVNVIRHFAKVDGVRVPVSTESVAKVKFAGRVRPRRVLRVRVDQRPQGERGGEADAGIGRRRHESQPRRLHRGWLGLCSDLGGKVPWGGEGSCGDKTALALG